MKVFVLCIVIAAVLFEESNRIVGGATVTDRRREVSAGDAAFSLRGEREASMDKVGDPSSLVKDDSGKDERKRHKDHHKDKKNKNKKNGSGSSENHGSCGNSEIEAAAERLHTLGEKLETVFESLVTLLDNLPAPEPCTPPIPTPLFYAKFNEETPLVVVHGADEITTENDLGYSFAGTESDQDYLEIPLLSDSCVFNNNCESGYTISSRIKIPHCGENGFSFYEYHEGQSGAGCAEIDTPFPDDTWFRGTLVHDIQQETIQVYVDGDQVYTQTVNSLNYLRLNKGNVVGYQRSDDSVAPLTIPAFGRVVFGWAWISTHAYIHFSADDLMVWGEPLSAEHVAQISETTVPYPGQITGE